MRTVTIIVVLVCQLLFAEPATAEPSVAEAQALIGERRYGQAIVLLESLEAADNPTEVRFLLNAEIGRCRFHLGEYERAHERFAAAMRIHPERVESALYLEATSYLLGKKDLALQIFEQILKSGGRDLYLAVTLPGESRFLAEAMVWRLLDEHQVPLEIDLATGSALGVSLGASRQEAMTAFGADSAHRDAPALSAQAGPRPTWAFSFGEDGRLTDFVFFPENLLRYTPYRLAITNGLDWNSTPAACINLLGMPAESSMTENEELQMRWHLEHRSLTLGFGAAVLPKHPKLQDEAAILKRVHLKLQP